MIVPRRAVADRPGTAVVLAVAIVVASTTIGVAAEAAFPPANDGWVTDLAGFLTPQQERSLETLMESYRQGSAHEIALLTVPDLGGRTVEQYALEVGRAWGLGPKDTNAGALLLVARDERKIRIEVGRGLEGTITDSIAGRIIRDVIAPDFKGGRYYEGLASGIQAMHAAAGGDYAAIPDRGGSEKTRRFGSLVPLLIMAIVIFNIIRRGGGRGGRGGGILPWLILGSMSGRRSSGWNAGRGGGFGGGGFGGFGGGGGFSGGGASGGW